MGVSSPLLSLETIVFSMSPLHICSVKGFRLLTRLLFHDQNKEGRREKLVCPSGFPDTVLPHSSPPTLSIVPAARLVRNTQVGSCPLGTGAPAYTLLSPLLSHLCTGVAHSLSLLNPLRTLPEFFIKLMKAMHRQKDGKC